MALKESFFGAVRRRTFICWRKLQISASSVARDRIRSTIIQPISLQISLIARSLFRFAAARQPDRVYDRGNDRALIGRRAMKASRSLAALAPSALAIGISAPSVFQLVRWNNCSLDNLGY
jgi:hypothetical protein